MEQKRIKVLVMFGTRPEAIKMVPLIPELQKYPDIFEPIVVSTGQHREMLAQVLALFEIEPDHDLDVMVPNQTLAGLTSRLIQKLDALFSEVKPDVVLVHGDTTTALAGGLAAYYHQIPIGHVEAGLRTYDKYSPFPEEMNRHLVDTLATFHFAPTQTSADHLRSEGLPDTYIRITGNTVIDALQTVVQKPCDLPLDLDWGARRVILVTAHRRESFGEPLENICQALKNIAAQYPDVEIVYPVHYNPNVRRTVYAQLEGVERIHLIDPLDYLEFAHMMAKSYLILTDSGGIQEEAPALGVPVLVMRDVTERPEAVAAGTVRIVGTDTAAIEAEVDALMQPAAHRAMSQAINPYGDGLASSRIVSILKEAFAHEPALDPTQPV
ncbi:MAG: UDP-N-acetylglucosamine 2-epimerase (non-hydrolyzing) [Rhodothermales bacterium]